MWRCNLPRERTCVPRLPSCVPVSRQAVARGSVDLAVSVFFFVLFFHLVATLVARRLCGRWVARDMTTGAPISHRSFVPGGDPQSHGFFDLSVHVPFFSHHSSAMRCLVCSDTPAVAAATLFFSVPS